MFRRRKQVDEDAERPDEAGEPTATGAGADGGSGDLRADGPWDASELDLPEDDETRVDLGGLLVRPTEELELQLQVDEPTGTVVAALLAGQEGAVELRAFAAPRHGDIWDEVRRQVAAEVSRMGGTATEVDGLWGTELEVVLGVELEDGQVARQLSRVVGIPGPRWLLRATLFGRPAVEPRADGDVETALRDVVVVRGSSPIPPMNPLPLTVPPNAQRIDPEA